MSQSCATAQETKFMLSFTITHYSDDSIADNPKRSVPVEGETVAEAHANALKYLEEQFSNGSLSAFYPQLMDDEGHIVAGPDRDDPRTFFSLLIYSAS